ncbi:MAG: preQ(1) synthase [Candidatus Ratteibacteria bacterium]
MNKKKYSAYHKSGLDAVLPELQTFQNQFPSYTIRVEDPEFTSICPKTGLPDFGTIIIEYEPSSSVLELKSLKIYLQAYRNLGIFYENAVNRILNDIVTAAKPVWARVRGDFRPRGGIVSTIEANYPRKP